MIPQIPPDKRWIVLQPRGEESGAPCTHCGRAMCQVRGFVVDCDRTVASYLVTWAPGCQAHAVCYDLVFGRWDEQATAANRTAFSLDMHNINGENTMKYVDAEGRIAHHPDLFGQALTRREAMESPLAEDILVMANTIYRNEPRLAEVRKWGLA
jgi:hypothetical protein